MGQALFNEVNPGGRSCNGCHNSANNGTNTNDLLFFDIGTASAAVSTPDLPLYTFQHTARALAAPTYTMPFEQFVAAVQNAPPESARRVRGELSAPGPSSLRSAIVASRSSSVAGERGFVK